MIHKEKCVKCGGIGYIRDMEYYDYQVSLNPKMTLCGTTPFPDTRLDSFIVGMANSDQNRGEVSKILKEHDKYMREESANSPFMKKCPYCKGTGYFEWGD